MENQPSSDLQQTIQAMLDELTESGIEIGLQAAAYYQGKLILNAHSGVMDALTRKPVESDTLFVSMSSCKGITATVIHMLTQAGKLGYDDKVADYWPEFAANGKADITIRQVLCHEAGIPQMPNNVSMDTVLDWGAMVHEIEQLSPVWEPGTKTGYHGFTFGWILGELAERVDKRKFAQIVQEEICAPLGISHELYFGVPDAAESRVAKISGEELPWIEMPDHLLIKRMLPTHLMPITNSAWNESVLHQAVLPSANACITANALARMYASLIGDGVDGIRLLNSAQLEQATLLQTKEPDEVFMGMVAIPKALGYWLGNNESASAMGDRIHTFGHTGMGGMIGFADPKRHFSFALLKNRFSFNRGDQDTDVLIANKVREWIQVFN
ncbi:serine hydrolase domain-containing protein [Paenibacillus andongensis]|uniref:serine hydrolase domain-containing protein n=1 Tax=Paenibacillus andongensis TaxID=2975482 RepID=UPI0021BA7B03|nr:serine hydrolase domain-containing protein [Paenibacillus andongensis]